MHYTFYSSKIIFTPIPFALSIEFEKVFGSVWAINELSLLGFGVGLDEVTRYKQAVISNNDNDTAVSKDSGQLFLQFMVDNVDHNPCTLDGKGALHAMGSCAVATAMNGTFAQVELPKLRRQMKRKVTDVVKNKGIAIYNFIPNKESVLSNTIFKDILQLEQPHLL